MPVKISNIDGSASSETAPVATFNSRMGALKMYERIALAPSDAGTVCSARADAQRCWRCGKGEDAAMRLTLLTCEGVSSTRHRQTSDLLPSPPFGTHYCSKTQGGARTHNKERANTDHRPAHQTAARPPSVIHITAPASGARAGAQRHVHEHRLIPTGAHATSVSAAGSCV